MPTMNHRATAAVAVAAACQRHPDQQVTGFCASCLRERLAGLDPANSASANNAAAAAASTSRHYATTALRAIFKGSGPSGPSKGSATAASSSSALSLPGLRRSKSFSGGRGERFTAAVEPQRKSCDVRVRNTLWSLFNLDDESESRGMAEIEIESRNLGFSGGVGVPVIESKEDDEDEEEEGQEEEKIEEIEERDQIGDEIRVFSDDVVAPALESGRLVVEDDEEGEGLVGEVRTMKDHIDLESARGRKASNGRDLRDIAGSLLSRASVFRKKLQKWRRKQKMKNRRSNVGGESEAGGVAAMEVDKGRGGRQFRETQSEIADYGYGRRSCDTDPRFSLDAGRMSFDDPPRYSWDEPRASWDGYLIGRMFPRVPQMVSVMEDGNVPVGRSDNQIPLEEPMNSINEDETTTTTPGGSAQTRDYYSDSSSSHRRRKSLDHSNSIRKAKTATLATEAEEGKPVSNAKVTPATSDYFHGTKVLVTDRDLRDSKSNSLKDDRSESFESAFRDTSSVMSGGGRKGSKKSRALWSKGWSIFSFIHGRSGRKNVEEDRCCGGNVVERSFSESWPEMRREVNGDAKGALNRRAFRCNSSVSSRSLSNAGGLFSVLRSNETNGHSRKRSNNFVMERNRSARYSPSSLDNGLLRFYLTPLRGSRRSNSGKSRPKNSYSIARSMLRFIE
ncbi:hypothetical protein Syun_016687 [Stephania yunnanensis]|uniref:Uncharacterized protein n=1 Tax=Stephania yunnanensis TaxID=152371 RepID=A0AAP0J752_9MAGN